MILHIISPLTANEFTERERIDLDFKGAPGKQCRQIAAQQKGVGAGDIDVIFFGCVKATLPYLFYKINNYTRERN